MKKFFRFLMVAIIIIIISAVAHLYYLSTLAAKENYPDDTFFASEQNKRALIIMAHDDDAVGSAGTMSLLTQQGWKIREMCFFQQGGLFYQKDSAKNPVGKTSLAKVALIQGFEGTDPIDFNFRNDMNSETSYLPMPYTDFEKTFKIDSLLQLIGTYIQQYRPSVIFTLDDKIGGYGHPDHVLMAQLVIKYCKEYKSDTTFPVKKIYQAVFPPSLAENVLGRMPVYQQAKKVYNVDGMPLPHVQVKITAVSDKKKAAMQAYTTEQNSLKKIWPYYNLYPSWIYFRIFDRDFYRVLDVQEL